MNHIYTHEISMTNMNEMCFHEAEIIRFYQNENCINLELENVEVGKEIKEVVLLFKNIKKMKTDAVIIDSNLMFSPFGEVLDIIIHDHIAKILILWHRYSPHVCDTKVYNIEFEQFEFRIN